jgi:hypothetical protein
MNQATQADGRPILVIGSDDFADCPECGRRLDVLPNDAGDGHRVMCEDESGPIYFGSCPAHGGYRFQIEAESPVQCEHCGNDGSRAELYLSIDAAWKPDGAGGGAWELQARDDDGGTALDCLECDGQTECDRESLFPYGLMIQPPGASASEAAQSIGAGDLVTVIADGLDAACDGRGWDASHQAAANLANAAPAMLAALQRVAAWIDAGCDPSRKSIEAVRAAIAAATGEGGAA